MRNRPWLSVVTVLTATPLRLVATTVAPGITAPEVSVIVPDNVEPVVATEAGLVLSANAAGPKGIGEVSATLTAWPFHGEGTGFQCLPASLLKKSWFSVSIASRSFAWEAIERMARWLGRGLGVSKADTRSSVRIGPATIAAGATNEFSCCSGGGPPIPPMMPPTAPATPPGASCRVGGITDGGALWATPARFGC